jgi:N,N'-diacetyllegionaminate synthase
VSARSYGRPTIEIAGRPVGPGHPCYVIAEAGSNHNRDLDTAKRLIDAAAGAGADAVKFQTYTAEGLYSRKTPNPSYLKKDHLLKDQETVWELIKRVEIPWEWHEELAAHTAAAGLDFLSSPFEEAAVDLLEGVKVPAYKIASYEITHLPLIEYAARTGKPLLVSTGMASLADIERALDTANAAGCEQVALLHCAINYPPRFDDLNLRAIQTLASAFQVPVGWSDHTMGHTADVAAVTLGACLVEKHYTLSREQEGPDHAFALEPDELTAMVTAIREAEESLGSPVKRVTGAEAEMFRIGRRSLVAARAIEAGATITREDIAVKRPGYGIPVYQLDIVIGRRAAVAIEADDILMWPMLG